MIGWDAYRDLSSLPNVFSRWYLERLNYLLSSYSKSNQIFIESVLDSAILLKPLTHRIEPLTDLFFLRLTADLVCEIDDFWIDFFQTEKVQNHVIDSDAVYSNKTSFKLPKNVWKHFQIVWSEYREMIV